MTSDEPLSDRCAAKCSSGGYCENYPVDGTERCRMHGGTAAKKNRGDGNGNYKHGGYSDFLMSDLSDRECEAYESMVGEFEDPESALETIREQAVECYIKYKRTGDSRLLSEYRHLVETFNLAPNSDELNLNGEIDGEQTINLDAESAAAIREATGPE